MITITGDPDGAPFLLEDRSLPHQVVVVKASQAQMAGCIAISCNCLAGGPGRGRPRGIIEYGTVIPAARAITAWRAWHSERDIEV